VEIVLLLLELVRKPWNSCILVLLPYISVLEILCEK
jgi:hypothetical protein